MFELGVKGFFMWISIKYGKPGVKLSCITQTLNNDDYC